MKFFKDRRPTPTVQAKVDPGLLSRDLAETDKYLVNAERQAVTASIEVRKAREVNIRNGFAPAIEQSILRRLGGAQ